MLKAVSTIYNQKRFVLVAEIRGLTLIFYEFLLTFR